MTVQSASFAQSAEHAISGDGQEWFVATVRPQHELTVVEGLECRGLEPFCPTYQVHRPDKRPDRRTLRPPLFPGYVFCRFHRNNRMMVLTTPGVLSIVGFGGTAVAVDDAEISRLQVLVNLGLSVRPWPYLEAGDRVRINRGALEGLDGLVLRTQGDWLLVVSVTLLQRSVAVSLDRDLVTPLGYADRSCGISEYSRKNVAATRVEPARTSSARQPYQRVA
jgi:transcription antitermination factor NusG